VTSPVSVTFVGTGDAFGSGGRHQACLLVEGAGRSFLVDCGASSLVAMRRLGIAPDAVDLILVSHLHGDHFGGLPFFLLDAQLASGRSAPLTVAGPPGIEARLREATEVLFPGAWPGSWRFPLQIVELEPRRRRGLDGLAVTPLVVRHPSGAPAFAFRLEVDGRLLAYSGDTEWTPELVAVAEGADLFVVESYTFEQRVPFHLDLRTLEEHAGELGAKRLVLTHMGPEMLARADGVRWERAEEGTRIEL
jgi:ribonuclease BN (tRNA processing enzyme)